LLRWNSHGLKWLFFAHTAPFFGHVAGLCSLKKPSRGRKIAHFSHHDNPSQQVYSKYLNASIFLDFMDFMVDFRFLLYGSNRIYRSNSNSLFLPQTPSTLTPATPANPVPSKTDCAFVQLLWPSCQGLRVIGAGYVNLSLLRFYWC
jgi:hypothetical protein